ncbi:unnamed protein product [Pocillopora meandrina]|uniref:G-protein coupled receptors family 1 profile domain-containing protein n=1 Tax=Pocillopora meandrina TaxID=46732 RepID=A0AAU9X0R0_9CNID|nr:unnamed protein product [Pocillopora meandrina]
MTRIVVCVSSAVGETCIAASLLHLMLMSGERYLAIKHPFAYENGLVTEARIIMASGMAWMCAAIVYGIKTSILREIGVFFISAVISTVVYCHVVIYKEVRRNTQQIIANQVSLAVKEKLLNNKRAFNTTVVIVLTLFLCYIPTCIWLIVFIFLDGEKSFDVGHIAYFPITFLVLLNSSINPLIYTARIRHFRVAFFQMLTRKTFARGEELEHKISETFSPAFILRSTLSTFSNTFTCPLAILPNIVVIVAVKTKRQPPSKSSVPLACLAATLFAAGLIFSTYGINMLNTKSPFDPFEFISKKRANITSGVYSVLAITAALNIFTCPLAILLNGLVIVAVKTKRYLRTKSNISLACLATTDFAVGLIVQPFVVTNFSLFFTGSSLQTMISTSVWVFSVVGQTCIAASTLHLLLMSGERYLAIKHPFAYENGLVTEARIITASGLAWMCAAIAYGIRVSILPEISFVSISAVISAVVYCHVVIYKEVRRNTQQIIANQVSLAVKEKLLKNKRAFNTTVVIVLTLFLCYIPTCVWLIVFISLNGENSSDVGKIAFFPITFLLFLNSSINPLIYTARIRHFRVAFFQMLTRKTLAQAEELEKKMFGANRVGVA